MKGMSSKSAALRHEIESKLASRIPAALSPIAVQPPRLLPLANPEVNAILGGGLPIGGISEFTGPASSGRTSLTLSVLSEATLDSACAYIDVGDTFDVTSAASAGVLLKNLLWVRFSDSQPQAESCPKRKVDTTIVPGYRRDPSKDRSTQHRGIRHPRTETKGIDHALRAMLLQKAESRLKKMEGTPGYPNQKLSLASAPEEQIAYEHFNARRADLSDPIRRIDRKAAEEARERAHSPASAWNTRKPEVNPWSRLEKALKATDQILQAGGFRVVVLDLASTPAGQAVRIPLATWYRFSRAAQEGDAILLLLSQEICTGSSARCILKCSPRPVADESSRVFAGMTQGVEILRQREANPLGKKAPGRAGDWQSTASWLHSAGVRHSASK